MDLEELLIKKAKQYKKASRQPSRRTVRQVTTAALYHQRFLVKVKNQFWLSLDIVKVIIFFPGNHFSFVVYAAVALRFDCLATRSQACGIDCSPCSHQWRFWRWPKICSDDCEWPESDLRYVIIAELKKWWKPSSQRYTHFPTGSLGWSRRFRFSSLAVRALVSNFVVYSLVIFVHFQLFFLVQKGRMFETNKAIFSCRKTSLKLIMSTSLVGSVLLGTLIFWALDFDVHHTRAWIFLIFQTLKFKHETLKEKLFCKFGKLASIANVRPDILEFPTFELLLR